MTTKDLLESVMIGEGLNISEMGRTFGITRMQMTNYLKGKSEIKITTLYRGLTRLGYSIEIFKKSLTKQN